MIDLLAFDLGMSSGWAKGPPNARPVFGTIQLTPCKGDYGALMLEFEGEIDNLMHGVRMVGYEQPILHPKNQIHGTMIDVGLAVDLERYCADLGHIDYMSWVPNHLKSFFAGHGFAKKERMVSRARQLGYICRNHHEADALAVWMRMVAYYDQKHGTSYLVSHLDPIFTGVRQ